MSTEHATTPGNDHAPIDYFTTPIELWSVRDLTEALGTEKAAALLNTSRRVIYTTRNKSVISPRRLMILIEAVRADEANMRANLVALRNRAANRTAAA